MTDFKDFIALAEELQREDPETYETVIGLMRTTLGEKAKQEKLLGAARQVTSAKSLRSSNKALAEYLTLRRQLL